jgi:sulfur carrier protein ThiS
MRIKLHLSGPIKAGPYSDQYSAGAGELEIRDRTTPREVLGILDIPPENIIALINGKPVNLDRELSNGDRVVLMLPQSGGEGKTGKL